jgi:hypothetical protein
MKLKILVSAALAIVLATGAFAQVTTEKGSKSDQTNLKIHKLDLLIKILPLALKKEQFDDLLLAIEKGRATEKAQLQKEDDLLEGLDPKVSEALDAAINKNAYPSKDLQTEIAQKTTSTGLNRRILAAQIADQIYNAISKTFNAGQLKVMAGSFDDRFIDSSVKKGDLKDDTKIKFYITAVFLDTSAYDLLVALQKSASPGTDKKN